MLSLFVVHIFHVDVLKHLLSVDLFNIVVPVDVQNHTDIITKNRRDFFVISFICYIENNILIVVVQVLHSCTVICLSNIHCFKRLMSMSVQNYIDIVLAYQKEFM